MRRQRWRLAFVAAAALYLTACTSGPDASHFAGPVGSGERLYADSIEMTAPPSWDKRSALAEFVPGTVEDGVEAIEFQLGYGETAIVWNFGGFVPGELVRVSHDVLVDLFGTQTALSFSYLSGTVTAKDAHDPRDEITDAIGNKWADADPGAPDATRGWETVAAEVPAGRDGVVSVVMILGRAADDPPVVFGYFTNPVAETAE